MRQGTKTDFQVMVENVGSFTFGKRTMKDEIKIQVEYARLIEGVDPTEWLETVCGWIATLKVLTVNAPDGWDIDSMDPLDQDTYGRMASVHAALRDQERSFRSEPKKNVEAGREGTG